MTEDQTPYTPPARSMDSAPRNGTPILGQSPDFGWVEVAFQLDEGGAGAARLRPWLVGAGGFALQSSVLSKWAPLPDADAPDPLAERVAELEARLRAVLACPDLHDVPDADKDPETVAAENAAHALLRGAPTHDPRDAELARLRSALIALADAANILIEQCNDGDGFTEAAAELVSARIDQACAALDDQDGEAGE